MLGLCVAQRKIDRHWFVCMAAIVGVFLFVLSQVLPQGNEVGRAIAKIMNNFKHSAQAGLDLMIL